MEVQMKFIIFFVNMLFLILSFPAHSAEKISFITYHLEAPFIVDKKARLGLTYDLADMLTHKSGGRFHFVVEELPRLRLDSKLERNERLVVPWANPKWFQDHKMKFYFWSSSYMQDSNSIISPSSNPVEYSGPNSMIGKTISGLLGTRWVGLDPLVEANKIKRENAISFLSAIRMTLRGRSDVTLLPTPIAKFIISRENLSENIHFSARPHSSFERYFLVNGRRDIRDYLETQIEYLNSSLEWKSILASYGM